MASYSERRLRASGVCTCLPVFDGDSPEVLTTRCGSSIKTVDGDHGRVETLAPLPRRLKNNTNNRKFWLAAAWIYCEMIHVVKGGFALLLGLSICRCNTINDRASSSEAKSSQEDEELNYFEIESSAFVTCPVAGNSDKAPAFFVKYNGECFKHMLDPGFIGAPEDSKKYIIHVIDSFPDVSNKGAPSPAPGAFSGQTLEAAYLLIKKGSKERCSWRRQSFLARRKG